MDRGESPTRPRPPRATHAGSTPTVIHEGLPTQLPGHRPRRDHRLARLLRRSCVDERGRERARYVMLRLLETRPREAASASPRCAAPTTSTRSRPSASRGSPATRRSSAGSARSSAGTPRSWSPARTARASRSAATSRRTSRRPASTRSASTTSSAARTTPAAATRSTSRATPPPASTPAPSSRAGSTEEQLYRFRQEVQHGVGKGLSSYPHPRLMPDFWEFPTVSMGLDRHQLDLPGAVQPLPAEPRHQGHRRPARVGVPRRRRDGRARVARRDPDRRPRGARQPHLRHQLQPAAARRPGDAATARSSRSWRRTSAAPAGTSSRSSGAASGTRCSPATSTACWSTG